MRGVAITASPSAQVRAIGWNIVRFKLQAMRGRVPLRDSDRDIIRVALQAAYPESDEELDFLHPVNGMDSYAVHAGACTCSVGSCFSGSATASCCLMLPPQAFRVSASPAATIMLTAAL